MTARKLRSGGLFLHAHGDAGEDAGGQFAAHAAGPGGQGQFDSQRDQVHGPASPQASEAVSAPGAAEPVKVKVPTELETMLTVAS